MGHREILDNGMWLETFLSQAPARPRILPSPLTGVPGFETVAEQDLLARAAASATETIVEIGAFLGQSASILASRSAPSVDVFSVDLFPSTMLDCWVHNVTHAGLSGRVTAIKASSAQAASDWANRPRPISALFIDGDHSADGCALDARLWTPFVHVGGIVLFHDYPPQNRRAVPFQYQVRKGVERWLAEPPEMSAWEFTEQADTLRAYRRTS